MDKRKPPAESQIDAAAAVPTSGDGTRRLALALASLVIAVLWTLCGYLIVSSREREHDAIERSLTLVRDAAVLHVAQTMAHADGALAATSGWIADHADADLRSDPRLRRQAAPWQGQALTLALADDAGRLFSPGSGVTLPLPAIGDTDYFRSALASEAKRLHIGAPLFSGESVQLPLVARLESARDGFVAAVVLIDARALASALGLLRAPEGGAISLVRRDGVLLARTPLERALLGRSLLAGALFRDHLPGGESGFVHIEQAIVDGGERFMSYGPVGKWPLLVAASVVAGEATAVWRRQATALVLLTALVSLVVAALAWRLSAMLGDLSRKTAELQHLASTDLMTGVHNRAHFLELLYREYARGMRYRTPLSLMVLDLDFFKQINDGYGHAAGDEALRAFAGEISSCLRAMDILGRLGGEEFGVVLPNTTLVDAEMVAERIRMAVSRIAIETGYGTVRFTTSIGVTQTGEIEDSVEEFLARADTALHRAKVSGRNRVARRMQADPGPLSMPPRR